MDLLARDHAPNLNEHSRGGSGALSAIESCSTLIDKLCRVFQLTLALAMALIMQILHHSVLIDIARAIKWVSKRAIGAKVGQLLTLVDDSNLEKFCACFLIDCINIQDTCIALQIDIRTRLGVGHGRAVSHRATQVAKGELTNEISRLASEGVVTGELNHEWYHNDHTDQHEHHQLHHDIKVGIEAIA